MMLSSPHVHTQFCDGKTPAEDMVLAAMDLGFASIGFSSHAKQRYDHRYAMDDERERNYIAEIRRLQKKYEGKLIEMDEFGFMPFALAAVIGVLVGSIKIGTFSLTTTGGCLLTALIFGHFARIGKISIMPAASTLKVFREFGLMLFLIGAGISGGAEFIAEFQAVYFVYGVIITIIPMIVGFLFAKYVLKLPLLNNLGSITGGMTSTPALGTLIGVSKTEDVASAYAATYPFALIAVVLASQFIILLCS
jgi:putative transport protein